MALYRFDVGSQTLWITADTDEGALAMARSYLADGDGDAPVTLTDTRSEAVLIQVPGKASERPS